MLRVLALSMLSLLSGCSWVSDYLRGDDNSTPPAELSTIDSSVAIEELWDVSASSGTDQQFVELRPAVEEGRIYVAGHEGDVRALDAGSGSTLWTVETDLPISAGVGVGSGLVLVGTSNGEVLALYSSSGEEAWRARVPSEVLAPPRVADNVVVVRTVDGTFTGFDARNGTQLWAYTYTVPVLTLRGSSPPLLAQGVAITGLDTGKLLVLALANGAPIWERTIAPPRGRTELDRMVDIDAEPAVVGGVLYTAAYQGSVTAIDLRNGNTLWTRDFSSYSGLNADGRRVYAVAADDAVWALDAATGGSLWKQTGLSGRRLTTPVVVGDFIVVGDFEGYLHWLNRTDGRIEGRVRADGDSITTAPVVQNDALYVLSDGGTLSAYRVRP